MATIRGFKECRHVRFDLSHKHSNQSIKSFLHSCLKLPSKGENRQVIDETLSDRELLKKVRLVVTDIIDPAEKCKQLIKVSEEYTFLEDGTQLAGEILNEANLLLEDEVKDPNVKATLWLEILERYKEEEAEIADKERIDSPVMQTRLRNDLKILTRILPSVTDAYVRCKVLLEMGRVYEELDQQDQVVDVLDQAWKKARSISDGNKKVAVLCSIASSYGSVDFSDKALEVLQQAFNYAKLTSQNSKMLDRITLECEDFGAAEGFQELLQEIAPCQ